MKEDDSGLLLALRASSARAGAQTPTPFMETRCVRQMRPPVGGTFGF